MNTKINFIRGLKGMGVVIEIKYQNARVIFDFGAPFEPLTQIYDGTVLPRVKNRVKDALLLNKAPQVDYVYLQEDLQDLTLKPFEDSPYQTAVFISHCHLDHMSEIDKIAPAIPVYLHQDGLKLKQALEAINEDKHYRDYSGFNYHETITIGQIKVTPIFSDHCCIGAAGFLVETPDSTIYYSGDIRFHGLQAHKAWDEFKFINKKIDLLIVDCTTSSPTTLFANPELLGQVSAPSKDILEGETSEQDIYDDVSAKLRHFEGLGVFNLYHRDIRMLAKMIEIGQANQRTTVFEPATAYIINKLLNRKVSVLLPDIPNQPSFYQEVCQNNEIILKDEIIKNPQKYFIQNSYKHILELSDYDGLKGIYFHLFGEPLTTKEKHYQILRNVLNKLDWGFNSYSNLYSFSHCYPNHLAEFIRLCNCTSVVGVHSANPENFNAVNAKKLLPIQQHEYNLINGELK